MSEALKSHPSAAESWLRPLLDTMSCNRSSKVGVEGPESLGRGGYGGGTGYGGGGGTG